MDSVSPLPASVSDNPIVSFQTMSSGLPSQDPVPDFISIPVEEDASLIEANDEVCIEIFQQPHEMEEDNDEDDTPLINLRSKTLQKLCIT